MRRPRTEEPLPSSERWLLSWSDFVTLLLAVFAAMYAGASVDLAKANAVAHSVGQALGVAAAPASLVAERPDARQLQMQLLEKSLAASLAGLGLGDRISLRREGKSLAISIEAELLFAEGDARLSQDANHLLAGMATALSEQPCAVRVEGHTDATPIANPRFASNWELSAARAAVVVRRLVAAGVPESRLSAVAFASNRPLAANDTDDGRHRNRRVQLTLVSDD